jgi:hypothetical protein
MIGLERVLTYRFSIRGPLGPTEGSPRGARQYWEMTRGTLTGDGLRAEIAMPGSDWMGLSPDGYWRPDVRVPLQTDDGALILMHYTGLVEQTDRFIQAASTDRATDWDDQYMRFAVFFDTGAERYTWLNQRLFLARGRILGTTELEYEIYRVT